MVTKCLWALIGGFIFMFAAFLLVLWSFF
jgi:hypothetical protein